MVRWARILTPDETVCSECNETCCSFGNLRKHLRKTHKKLLSTTYFFRKYQHYVMYDEDTVTARKESDHVPQLCKKPKQDAVLCDISDDDPNISDDDCSSNSLPSSLLNHKPSTQRKPDNNVKQQTSSPISTYHSSQDGTQEAQSIQLLPNPMPQRQTQPLKLASCVYDTTGYNHILNVPINQSESMLPRLSQLPSTFNSTAFLELGSLLPLYHDHAPQSTAPPLFHVPTMTTAPQSVHTSMSTSTRVNDFSSQSSLSHDTGLVFYPPQLLQWMLDIEPPWKNANLIEVAIRRFPTRSALKIATRTTIIIESARQMADDIVSVSPYTSMAPPFSPEWIWIPDSVLTGWATGTTNYPLFDLAQMDEKTTNYGQLLHSSFHIYNSQITERVSKILQQPTVDLPWITAMLTQILQFPQSDCFDIAQLIVITFREVAKRISSSGNHSHQALATKLDKGNLIKVLYPSL